MSYTKLTDFASKDALLTGNPSKLVRGTELGAEFDAIEVADALNIKPDTVATASGKTTPVDADLLTLFDSASTFSLKKLTWANLKATVKTYFDTLYAVSGANTDITSLGAVASINGGALAGFRNRIMNGNFGVNQRAYVSGAAVGTGLYGHDRWKMATSGDTYTFSTTANVTTVTIPAGKVLQQVVEGLNLETGTYTLSWVGTAQGKIGGGSYGASGITGSITGGTNTTIEFGPGTVSKVQLEFGSVATVFEQRPYGVEFGLCQRYCQTLPYMFGNQVSATTSTFATVLPTPMRAGVSNILTVSSVALIGVGAATSLSAFTMITGDRQFFRGAINHASAGSIGVPVEVVTTGVITSEL